MPRSPHSQLQPQELMEESGPCLGVCVQRAPLGEEGLWRKHELHACMRDAEAPTEHLSIDPTPWKMRPTLSFPGPASWDLPVEGPHSPARFLLRQLQRGRP